jgi:flagellar hook-associated protein 3 FlgL
MRTTFNSVNRHTKYVIEQRYAELANLQNKLSTGKELSRPSDGAVETSNVLKIRSDKKYLVQLEKNINDGTSWMSITDTTMSSMNTAIQRARELAIQGDSDTLSANERAYLAEEVQQLARQLVSLINTKYKGDYLFAGSHTNLAPAPINESDTTPDDYANYQMAFFDGTAALPAPAAPNTYKIMSPEGSPTASEHKPINKLLPGTMELVIAGTSLTEGTDYTVDYLDGTITALSPNAITLMGQDFRPSTPANPNYSPTVGLQMNFEYVGKSKDIYGNNVSTDSKILREIESGVVVKVNTSYADLQVDSSTDIISSLIELGSGLRGDNKTTIKNSMDNIDKSFNKLLSAMSENGAKLNLFEGTLDRNDQKQISFSKAQSELEDADYSEVVADFSVAETVFNAALQSSAKIMQNSLADFIR